MDQFLNYIFRYATSVYGQKVLLGANWHLFWWFVGAGFAFVILHALTVPMLRRRVMGESGRAKTLRR